MHSFEVFYLFLHPSKIIITDDLEIKVIDHIKINEEWATQLSLCALNDESRFISPDLYTGFKDLKEKDLKSYLQFDLYSLGCLMFYAFSGQLPWNIPGEEIIGKEKIIYQWNEKQTFLKEKDKYTEEMQPLYNMIKKLLNYEYKDCETVRIELEKTKEVTKFLEDGHLEFDFKEKCEKVISNINNLVLEIDKLFDDSQLKKHFNTIHQAKLKFSNNLDIDETKPKNSIKENQLDEMTLKK